MERGETEDSGSRQSDNRYWRPEGRRVELTFVFDPGGYVNPAGYSRSMFEQAQKYVATQKRAAGQSYRANIWTFLARVCEGGAAGTYRELGAGEP